MRNLKTNEVNSDGRQTEETGRSEKARATSQQETGKQSTCTKGIRQTAWSETDPF